VTISIATSMQCIAVPLIHYSPSLCNFSCVFVNKSFGGIVRLQGVQSFHPPTIMDV
jgi:hypothetical protein